VGERERIQKYRAHTKIGVWLARVHDFNYKRVLLYKSD
jgi:hypothetical protein